MNLRTLLLIFIIFSGMSKAQKFTSDYVALYKLEYEANKQKNDDQFILFINAKEGKTYFMSTKTYVKDTAKIGDPMQLLNYETDFNERIFVNGRKVTVMESVKAVNLTSEENVELKWDILDKIKKTENGNSVQLAKTKAYGRVWYAWFSKDIPIDAGPYKFKNLPGFIVSLYDENQDFIFTLQQFKKKKKTIIIPNFSKFKKVDKKDFNKMRYRIQISDDGSVIFQNAKERENWFKSIEKYVSKTPLLDIQYPIK